MKGIESLAYACDLTVDGMKTIEEIVEEIVVFGGLGIGEG